MSPNRKKVTHTKGSLAKASSDSSVDLTRLLDIVAGFGRQTIAVVGDFVLDEFVSGEISRISREAPVLILRHRRTESYPGGAANAVNNLADLGARVLPVGVVGNDEGGRALLDLFRSKRVDTAGIVRAATPCAGPQRRRPNWDLRWHRETECLDLEERPRHETGTG